MVDLVGVVLADTEDVWNKRLDDYREPHLTIFNGTVQSSCGNADASTGPFYCSADERVYIDLSFYTVKRVALMRLAILRRPM